MKRRRLISALAIVATSVAAQAQGATIIDVNDFSPTVTTNVYSATASQGTLGSITVSPTVPTNAASTVNSTTYGFSLTGLTIDSIPGFSLTWDIVMKASGTDGLVVNGVASRLWVVDLAGSNPTQGGSADNTRVGTGESITITLGNIVLTGPGGSVSSAVFTAADRANQSGTNVTETAFGTSTYTVGAGASTAFRFGNIDTRFVASAIVVPAPAALPAGLTLIGLIAARRRRVA